MEELILFKKQLSFIYLLISLLYLATIFNFSLYIHFYTQISDNLSNQISQKYVDKRSINALDEQENRFKRERFKRDFSQFNLPKLDLIKVWSNEDENLKQKLIQNKYLGNNERYLENFESNDDNLRIQTKKIRSVNEDKQSNEKPKLHPPLAHSVRSKHRSHHQKRRLTTTTEQSNIDQEQSVEFFSQPQPSTHTDGKLWLNSYSRIPVSC